MIKSDHVAKQNSTTQLSLVIKMRTLMIVFLIFLLPCSDTCYAQKESDLDEAQKALIDARKYTQSGDYEKALERYVWFHNNALDIRPSYYGVNRDNPYKRDM